MKLYKNDSVLKYIFFLEIILIFSAISSFLVLHIIKERSINNYDKISEYSDLFKNYRILDYFLSIKNDRFSGEEEPDLRNPETDDPFIDDMFKLRSVKSLLDKKKYTGIYGLLGKLNNKYDFISREKHKLYLRYLYSQKRYYDFVKLFGSRPVSDLEIEIFLINSLLKHKEREKAFLIFKRLFKRRGLENFQKLISQKTLLSFLRELDYEFWFDKFKFLLRRNNYREFLIERKYVNAPQLVSLFRAEFFYKRKMYEGSKRYLNRVRAENLLDYKKRLTIKIDLRQDKFDDISKRIDELRDDNTLYAELLHDSASILLIKKDWSFH